MLINAQDDHKKGNKRLRAPRNNPRSNKNKVRKIKEVKQYNVSINYIC